MGNKIAPKLKDLCSKGNQVQFDSYRCGMLYYNIIDPTKDISYQFTVPISDTGNATFMRHDKAITFMRWIRKAIDNSELIEL